MTAKDEDVMTPAPDLGSPDPSARRRRLALPVAGLLALSACGAADVILPGERSNFRDGFAGQELAFVNEARPLSLPAAQANADWTHRGGGPDHALGHAALTGLQPLFTVPIGEGNSRRARITADPVVAGGRVFTLDARARVQATSTAGAVLWSVDLTPPNDGPEDASGGGLATDGARVFVTTGFGRLTTLDAATGAVLWVQDLNAPAGPPTVQDDTVLIVARDSRAWALDRDTGTIVWSIVGVPSTTNFGGGSGAALGGGMAVLPFPSGQVVGAFAQGGVQRWSENVAGERLGEVVAQAATDISGDPVIDGGRVYVGNVSGRTIALDLTSGDRLWTATEGALSPVVPAGDSVFLVNDLSELVRLDAATGLPIWRVALPGFVEERERRQRTRFAHYGPVLAGGQLIVASGDGAIRSFDPVSGALTGTVALPGGAASNPAVAGGVLYVVTQDGQLAAFR